MDEQEQSKGNPYLMDFIREKGKDTTTKGKDKGPAGVVAKRTGVGYQTVKQIFQGRNGASGPTLAKFAAAYPDFDIVHANTGKPGSKKVKGDSENSDDDTDWKTLFLKERDENNRLRKVNERLSISMLEKAGLLTDQEGVKIESSSQITADMELWFAQVMKQVDHRQEVFKVDGFVIPKKEEPTTPDAKVIQLSPVVPVYHMQRQA